MSKKQMSTYKKGSNIESMTIGKYDKRTGKGKGGYTE